MGRTNQCGSGVAFGPVVPQWFACRQDRKPETVLVNLLNPCGVAIQPQTGYVFVSSRFGVYCYDPSYKKPKEHRAAVEIDGYPDRAGVFGSGPKYDIGPLGLAFLDKDHLVVGDGSRKVGEDFVRVYKIPAKLPGQRLDQEGAAVVNLGPIKAGKDSAKGEGTFYGVAVGGSHLGNLSGGPEKGLGGEGRNQRRQGERIENRRT